MAEAGRAALWLAAGLAAVQVMLCVLGLRRGSEQGAETTAAMRPAAILQAALTAIALAMLIGVFLASDMSVRMVVENSRSAMPWVDRLAASLSHQQGAMLLWVTLLSVARARVGVVERRIGDAALAVTLAAQAAIALGFYTCLLSVDLFARVALPDSGESGPLQELGFGVHQPVLAAGFAGLSVALCLAVGALVKGRGGPALVRTVHPWVLGAWIALTLGITVRSYVDGRPFDPVDRWSWSLGGNAALLAWLGATVLLHMLAMLGTRGGLRTWTGVLAVVLIGTATAAAPAIVTGSVLIVAIVATSVLRCRRATSQAMLEQMFWPIAATGLAFAALVVFADSAGWLSLMGLSLAVGLGVATLSPLVGRNWAHLPLFGWGMIVAHLGFAVSAAGVAGDAAFARETLVTVSAGERARVGPFTVAFDGIEPVIGDGWSALQAQLTVTTGDRTLRLFPQSRYALQRPTTGGSAVATLWPGQLHAGLEQSDAAGRWPLRLRWTPLVRLVWHGGTLMVLGGFMALIARVRRGRGAG
jgi:cytochrome c biogenesis factor